MKNLLKTLALLLVFQLSQAQESRTSVGDIGVAIGNSEGSFSADYFHNWLIGKKHKIEIGIGARFTSYFGKSQYYTTAPANITTGSTGPGSLFKEVITENIDSLLLGTPQVNSLNLALNLGYRISSKWDVGFSIDLIGFSLGAKENGTYINGAQATSVSAMPTSFNALLVGDNDRGSLNSEFYVRYFFQERWAVKAGFQYLFTEFTTETEVQQSPEPNDRFRNKSGLLNIGVTYLLK